MLDPGMAARFADRAEALLGELDAADPRTLVLEAEPRPVVSVPEDRLVEVAATFNDLADLKSPFTHGHSTGVAALARGAGERILAGSERLASLARWSGCTTSGSTAVATTAAAPTASFLCRPGRRPHRPPRWPPSRRSGGFWPAPPRGSSTPTPSPPCWPRPVTTS